MSRKKREGKEHKPRKPSTVQYFVEPLGDDPAHSNKVLNDYLGSAETRTAHSMPATKGHPRDVWQCARWEAIKLRASGKTTQAYFSLWSRSNNYGPIHWVGFLDKQQRKERDMVRTFKIGARPLTENTVTKTPF